MTHQSILVLVTKSSSLRASVTNFHVESGKFAALAMTKFGFNVEPKQIDMPTICATAYLTPLHALGDEWKLLAPPANKCANWCEWYFVKEA